VRLGPKDARYDWIEQPYAAVPYFVRSFNGFMRVLINLFCARVYTTVVHDRCTQTSLSIRVSWA
jgi:hypothetical protein